MDDLDLDIYITQIAAAATGESARIPIADWDTYCDDISDIEVQAGCRESVKQRFLFGFGSKHEPGLIKNCEQIEAERAKQGCISMMLLLTATREKQQPLCDRIPLEHTRFTCNKFFKPSKETTEEQKQEAIPVVMNTNVFLVSDEGKEFENRAADMPWPLRNPEFENSLQTPELIVRVIP